MRYPENEHHNMAGVTHPVPSLQELLHKSIQADVTSPLEYSTDISQAMRYPLSPDGLSPAITFEDNTHWPVMLINANRKHVDFVDPFGTCFLYSVRAEFKTSIKGTRLAHGRSQSGSKGYSLEETLELWNLSNMDTGEVDALTESNRSNRGIC
ncbi:TPA: hypothetical protein ACH3X2_010557 [Trebouxia sp. C0005]